jgi:hypothetical protein
MFVLFKEKILRCMGGESRYCGSLARFFSHLSLMTGGFSHPCKRPEGQELWKINELRSGMGDAIYQAEGRKRRARQ